MIQRQIVLLCIALVLRLLAPESCGAAPRPNVRQQVVSLPAGSVVEVKLEDKRKLKGRLGEVDDAGFELQHLVGNQVTKERFAYDAVRSVKDVKHGMRLGTKIVLGVLAGLGVYVLVAIVVCVSGACD